MARPKNADSGRTRQAIIEAALAESDEFGAPNITMKSIAARAEVSIGLISHYFGSKEALLKECSNSWSTLFQHTYREVLRVFQAEPTPERSIIAAMKTALSIAREHQIYMRMLLRSVAANRVLPAEFSALTFPLADSGAATIAKHVGISKVRARAVVHQAAILIMRLGAAGNEDLIRSYGGTVDEAWEVCSNHTAYSILFCLQDLPASPVETSTEKDGPE